MILVISNKGSLDYWMNQRRNLGHDMVPIKGPAPVGSTYEDGTLIQQPINIGWQDSITGETFTIKYTQAN